MRIALATSMSIDERKRLAALMIGAAIVRVLYLWFYSRQDLWDAQVVDALFHLNWADSIADGNVIGSRPFFKSPLYVYALAFWRWLFGDSILVPRLFGSALGLSSILFTYLLTRKIAIQSGWKNTETPALMAGGLQALYPSVIFFEAELLVDFMFTTLAQAAIYFALMNENKGLRRWLIAGVALGMAALTRATGLVLLPLFMYWAWREDNGEKSATTGIKRTLAVFVGAAIIIMPVTVRNYALSGDFTLIATSGGVNFYIGNNASSDPVSAALPQPFGTTWRLSDMRGLAEREEGRTLTDAEVSSYWSRKALEWITQNPGAFLKNYSLKLYTLLSAHPYSNNRALEVVYHDNPVLRFTPLNFALLLGLAALGWFAGWRKSRVMRRTLALAGIYGVVLCFFFINERFRLLPIVLLIPLAGIGAHVFVQWTRDFLKRGANAPSRIRTSSVMIAVGVGAFAIIPYGRPTENSHARSLYLRANSLLRDNDFRGAEKLYQNILKLDPDHPRAALNLGVAELRLGNSAKAENLFLQELRTTPNQPDALTNLASLKLIQGDYAASDTLSLHAYRVRPYDLTTVRIRARALAALGQKAELQDLLDSSRRILSGDPRYWMEFGLAYLQLADTAEARQLFEKGSEDESRSLNAVEVADWAYDNPDHRKKEIIHAYSEMSYRLGFLYGSSGRYRDAATMSAQAIALDSSLVEAYLNLTLAYVALGIPDSASAVYRSALERFSGDAKALETLRRIDPAHPRN